MNALKLNKYKSEETVKVLAAVMNISTETFSNIILNMSDTDVISQVNAMLSYIGPIIDENKGRITQVSENGIVAVFELGCENAVKCAITICQRMVGSGKESESFKDLSVGINFGLVCTSSVGYGDFRMPMTISEGTNIARQLSYAAHKYNSRILISESVASHIADINGRYSIRRLGNIYISNDEKSECVYDVYDGDLIDEKNRKRRSKLFFETGVDLFLQGNHLQARSYFIELIKSNRDDRAAKQYLFLCDRCMSEDVDEIHKKNIEVW